MLLYRVEREILEEFFTNSTAFYFWSLNPKSVIFNRGVIKMIQNDSFIKKLGIYV